MPEMTRDDQAHLVNVVADAFDNAATTCGTAIHAAHSIIDRMTAAGFSITRVRPAPRPPWSRRVHPDTFE